MTWITSIAWRLAALGFLWWILTGGSVQSWWIGAPAMIAAAIWSHRRRGGDPGIRWRAVPVFLAFVVARSIAGSVDVARRALGPRAHLEPSLFEYTIRLDRGGVLLASLVTMLPGTLSVRLVEGHMLVHALGDELSCTREIRALEDHVARVFVGASRLGQNAS